MLPCKTGKQNPFGGEGADVNRRDEKPTFHALVSNLAHRDNAFAGLWHRSARAVVQLIFDEEPVQPCR
jgi:hypothetical protein